MHYDLGCLGFGAAVLPEKAHTPQILAERLEGPIEHGQAVSEFPDYRMILQVSQVYRVKFDGQYEGTALLVEPWQKLDPLSVSPPLQLVLCPTLKVHDQHLHAILHGDDEDAILVKLHEIVNLSVSQHCLQLLHLPRAVILLNQGNSLLLLTGGMLQQEGMLAIVGAPKVQDLVGGGLVVIVNELSHTLKTQGRTIRQLEGRWDLGDTVELATEAEKHEVVVFQGDQLHG